ncbi:MAG: 30S ribosomal protein S13 [Patescibacteria group bacterium]
MVRIAGVSIPDNKKIAVSLTYVFGIGAMRAAEIVASSRVNPQKRASELTNEEWGRVRDVIEKKFKVEGDLRREITANIKHLKDVGAYRGLRHAKGLPVRGQRTRTNSRTRRGNVRRTTVSGKRTLDKK